MRWKLSVLARLMFVTIWMWVIIPFNIISIGNIRNVDADALKEALTLSGSTTPLPTLISNVQSTSGSSIDSTTLAAWIGFVGVILAALIAAGVAVYQTKRNARLEREKIELQARVDTERTEHQRQRQQKEMDDADALCRYETSPNHYRTSTSISRCFTCRLTYCTFANLRHEPSFRGGKYLCEAANSPRN